MCICVHVHVYVYLDLHDFCLMHHPGIHKYRYQKLLLIDRCI